MKNKYKLIPIFVLGIISLFVMGLTDVHASTLSQNKVDGVWYTRRGGGKPYASAQYAEYFMDGKVVYCIEPGTPITTSDYVGNENWINSPYSDEVNRKIQLYGYYGYEYPGHKTLRYKLAAQALIWETTGGQIIEYWTQASGYGDYINVDQEKNEIRTLAEAHYQKPSFTGETRTTVINQPTSFTDNNGILSQYNIHNSDNATSIIDGNTLTVTPNAVGEVNITLVRKTYTNDPTTIFVGIDEVSQKMGFFGLSDPTFSNVRLNVYGGKVSIEKLDSKTKSFKTTGDGKLNGAVYGIYDNYDIRIGELTTNGTDIVTSDYLPKLGTFYLKEEVSSLGYKLDSTRYYFDITNDNLNPKITIYEEVIEKEVELYKVKADGTTTILKSEPNVKFEFYLKSNNQLYTSGTTDSKGHLKVTLPYGTFNVHQATTTPNFEKIKDFEIVINDNDEEHITKIISNAEVSSKLKLIKIDSDSKRVLVKDGIQFKIKNLDTNEYVCQNITYPNQTKVCVFETNKGVFITPYVLSSGNYQIEELENQQIDGYVWNSNALKFSITDNSKFIYDEEYGVMLEVKFENKEVKGNIEITKNGEQANLTENGYTYTKVNLANVKFGLYANEDIYDGTKTLIHKKDSKIGEYITNKNGIIKIENLYLGKYYLQEITTDKNHVLDNNKYNIELKYKDQYTEKINYEITIKNRYKTGKLEFTKTDFSNSKPLPDTLIEIYTDKDELIYSGCTDENGKVIINKLPIGNYYILEKEAPKGYIVNEEKMPFEIKENGEIVKSNMADKKIKGKLEFTKTDFSEDKALPNTLIEIYKENDELVYSGRTDENGKIIIDELEYGKYYILEKEAPEDYELNPEKMYFEIKENGEVVKCNMKDKLIIKVPKTGITSSNTITIITIVSIIAGLGFIIYDKNKKK